MKEFDSSRILERLQEKFNNTDLKEISFSLNPDTDNLKMVLEEIQESIENFQSDEIREFYIEKKTEKIIEFINSDIEYKQEEEFCSNYFQDIPNSEIQVNNYDSDNYIIDSTIQEKQKCIIEKLLDNLSIDIIEFMEFQYYSMGTPFYNIGKEIFYQISNLGEINISLSDEMKAFLNKSKIQAELENEIEKESCVSFSSDHDYCYYNISYDSMVYYINYDSFISLCIDCVDETYLLEIQLIKEFIELVGENSFSVETLKNIVDMI